MRCDLTALLGALFRSRFTSRSGFARAGRFASRSLFRRLLRSSARTALGHYGFLERFCRQELKDALRRNFDLLASRRIARHARRPIANFELPEARNFHRLAADDG